MGWLTPVLLWNDSIHMIKDDPYFGVALSAGHYEDHEIPVRAYKKTWVDVLLAKVGLYRKPNPNSWRGVSSCAQVLKSEHADTPRVLVIAGNTWLDISAEYYKNVDIDWGGKNHSLTKKGEALALHRNLDYYEACVKIAQEYATKGKVMVKLLKEKKNGS